MDQGKRVYDAACLACHGAGGEGGVGKAIAGSPVVLGDIATHMALVANGVSGTAMQAFGAQLSAVDMAAVLTYQRNAFGNNTGVVVQPGDVTGAKNG
jgi:cytochrome c oxidase subunit 2